ncbi:MAG: hypothetical protein ACI9MD_002272, partial [Psychrobacter glaciei]
TWSVMEVFAQTDKLLFPFILISAIICNIE